MASFSFPKQLANHLESALPALLKQGSSLARLPARSQLVHLLEVAYLASMETDEGRSLTFTVCCSPANPAPTSESADSDVERWPFAVPRRVSVQELRRLAVAANLNSAAIWVQYEPDEAEAPCIVGLLNLGNAWAIGRPGAPVRYEGLPESLMLRVEGPGRLTVYHNEAAIVTLSSGVLQPLLPNRDTLYGARPIIEEGRAYFLARLSAARTGLSEDAASWTESAYENLIFAILNTIQRAGHGGALLLASPSCRALQPDAQLLKPKYDLQPAMAYMEENFMAMLLARIELSNLVGRESDWRRMRHGLPESSADMQRFYLLGLEIRTAQQRLFHGANFTANLSGTDGATLLTSQLRVPSFGVEIVPEGGQLPVVYEVDEASPAAFQPLDVEEFGMRHRSAMRLCASAEGVAAFVVSQDGGVNLIFSRDGQVFFQRNLPVVRGVN